MAIPLTGAGSLGVKWGHHFGAMDDQLKFMGNTTNARILAGAPLVSRGTTFETDYAGGTADYVTIDGLQNAITQAQGAVQGWLAYLGAGSSGLAGRTLIQMANADTPLLSQTLSAALNVLIAQMVANGTSIQSSTVAAGAQTAVGSPTGDSTIVLSLKRGDGYIYQTIFAETLSWTCSQDTQTGAQKWQEQFVVSGKAAADPLSYLWPGGSGLNTTLNAVDCDQSNDGFNLLQNSGFETFTTANNPDNWILANSSVAGTDIFKESTNVYRSGGNGLKILGDGATLSTLRQPFNATPSTTAGAGGTSYVLQPDTVYHVNYFYKLSNASPATGVLRLALVDGSNAVMNDDLSVANSNAVTLSGIANTTWHAVNFAIRTPKNVSVTTAGNYKLEFKLTTALENAKSVYIDCLSLTPASQLYSGGPLASIHSGGTPPIFNDSWTTAMTNTMGVYAAYLERCFNLQAQDLIVPYSGSPTISDSLVV